MASKTDEVDRHRIPDRCLSSKSKTNITSSKSLVRSQNQHLHRIHSSRNGLQDSFACTSRNDPFLLSPSPEEPDRKCKLIPGKDVKVFSNHKSLTYDCWNSVSGELPMELVELYKEEDKGGEIRNRRLSFEGGLSGAPLEKLSHTKEFHVLTEVQKERILTAVEDAIKKLANSEVKDHCQEEQRLPDALSVHSEVANLENYFCKKFLLPWVIMKVMEMVVCHIIQLTFLSNDSYFMRKYEFLPVVVTYYFTLFIVIFSLVMHILRYSYGGMQHPYYFMCIISGTILTMTTALGILIMLCSMNYYRTFREILVLVFIAALLCLLIAELCICYVEVKNFWNRLHSTEQYYIS